MRTKSLPEGPVSRPSMGPLWDVAPDIRTTPPIAPGSDSSRRAALAVDSPFRRESWRRILTTLYAAEIPLSREQIAERVGMKESALCGRLSELRPIWVQSHDGAVIAASGCHVDGYSLTVVGKGRCEQALSPR